MSDRTVRPARVEPPTCLACQVTLVWMVTDTGPTTKVAMWHHPSTPLDYHPPSPVWPPGTFAEETP